MWPHRVTSLEPWLGFGESSRKWQNFHDLSRSVKLMSQGMVVFKETTRGVLEELWSVRIHHDKTNNHLLGLSFKSDDSVIVFLGGRGQSIPMTDIPEVEKMVSGVWFTFIYSPLYLGYFMLLWKHRIWCPWRSKFRGLWICHGAHVPRYDWDTPMLPNLHRLDD